MSEYHSNSASAESNSHAANEQRSLGVSLMQGADIFQELASRPLQNSGSNESTRDIRGDQTSSKNDRGLNLPLLTITDDSSTQTTGGDNKQNKRVPGSISPRDFNSLFPTKNLMEPATEQKVEKNEGTPAWMRHLIEVNSPAKESILTPFIVSKPEKDTLQKPDESSTEFLIPKVKPERSDKPPEFSLPNFSGRTPVTRSKEDLKIFYKAQDDGFSCSAFSMAMMYSDQFSGQPVNYGKEAQSFKVLAGTTSHGYRGDLQSIANKLEKLGLNAKAYSYKSVGQNTLDDLNKELAMGHSAVGHVQNPHTGNGHYIYIAGRTDDGKYIIGDSDRYNKKHFEPISGAHLLSMLNKKDGFVAGWSNDNAPATNTKGSAAERRTRRK